MTLLFTLLTLTVLGVIAAVATGKISGGLEEPSTSLAARGLPEGRVTPESLEAVRFSPAVRGYRMEEVDAVLDRLGVELARRDRQILQLSHELRAAEGAYRLQVARGAAGLEWAVPGTGRLPVVGSLPVNGAPDAEPLQSRQGLGDQGREAGSGEGVATGPTGHGGEGREHSDQGEGREHSDQGEGREHSDQVRDLCADEPGRREG